MTRSSLVSVRLPASLYRKLKEKAEREDYLDISEAVKGVIRQRYLSANDPEQRITKLRKEIMEKLQRRVKSDVNEQLVNELDQIKRILGGEAP